MTRRRSHGALYEKREREDLTEHIRSVFLTLRQDITLYINIRHLPLRRPLPQSPSRSVSSADEPSRDGAL